MKIEDVKQMIKEGRREEAIAILQQMLAKKEEDREQILMELGSVYHAMGDRIQALNHFNEVIRVNPGNTKARAYLDIINGILDYYCKDLLNP